MEAGILVVAHRPIASAFESAVLEIMKEVPDFSVVDIDSDEAPELQVQRVTRAWESINSERKVVILDVEGATPCNLLHKFCEHRDCLFVVPLSMSLLLKIICYRRLPLEEIEKKAREIVVSTKLIKGDSHANA